jgi:hypothetical protein
MRKYLSAARSILAIPKDDSSWDFIRDKHDIFIWTDDDTVQQWNEIARKNKAPQVDQRIDSSAKEEREFLTYKGRTVDVALTHSRDDREIIIHTLGRLVMADSDIRFCLDSHHSSDLAFLALPPADWKALEKEFGRKAVAYRFLAFPESLEEFLEQAFCEENNREYAEDRRVREFQLAAEQRAPELADYARKIIKPHCASVTVSCERNAFVYDCIALEMMVKTKTDAERDALVIDRKAQKEIVEALQKWCSEREITLSYAYIQSQETVTKYALGDWNAARLSAFKLL